jgi:hypothetical protein
MTNTRRLALTLVLALAVAPLAARQTTAGSDDVDVLLQAGLHREQVEGKVAEAIALYKQVIEKAGPSKRVLAARAQLQLARVYEKTGRPEAPEAYRTVLKEYLDQPTQVAAARESLARLAATSSQSGLTPRHHATEVYTIDAFSPDGQQMLIVTPDLADTQLLLKDRLTGHETVLATRTNEGRPLSGRMSPDGTWVSLGWLDYQPRTFGLRVVSVAGGAQKTLLPQQSVANLWNVGWSSDATAVLVSDGTVRPIKTIEPWRTLPGPPLGRISLSPDGATIAFTARSAEGASDAYIYVVDANGQNERAIVTMAGRNVEAVWTPGSDRLVFVHVDSPTDRSLWTVRLPLGEGPEAPSLVQGNFSGALIDMTRAGETSWPSFDRVRPTG